MLGKTKTLLKKKEKTSNEHNKEKLIKLSHKKIFASFYLVTLGSSLWFFASSSLDTVKPKMLFLLICDHVLQSEIKTSKHNLQYFFADDFLNSDEQERELFKAPVRSRTLSTNNSDRRN